MKRNLKPVRAFRPQRIFDNKVKGAKCPVCEKIVAIADYAFSTHFRWHIKRKEATLEQRDAWLKKYKLWN